MITVNSLSGGKTSSYMGIHYPADVNIFACVCIDYEPAKPKDTVLLRYVLEKLDGNFIATAESDKTLKVMMELEQIIGNEIVWVRGKSFDQIIDEAGCLPTWARRFCTTELKIRPIFNYLWPRYGKVLMNIGFRGDELKYFPWLIFPDNSNCMGCHHKPPQIIKENYKDEPEKLIWFALQEQKGKYNTWHDDLVTYFQIFEM